MKKFEKVIKTKIFFLVQYNFAILLKSGAYKNLK